MNSKTDILEAARGLLCEQDPAWGPHLHLLEFSKESAELARIMTEVPFRVVGDAIEITWQTEVIEINKKAASMFWMAFKEASSCADYCTRMWGLMMAPMYEFDFSTLVKTPVASGQEKLLLAYLEPFAGMKPRSELKVLCIGAGSEGRLPGLVYDPLALFLSRIGFDGDFWLYTEHASQQEYQCGSFRMHVVGEKFNYHSMPSIEPDVVLENRYEELTMSYQNDPSACKPVPLRPRVLKDGRYTFVLYETHSSTLKMRYWLSSHCASHSAHDLDKQLSGQTYSIRGGAHLIVKDGSVQVVGTSLTYGHYDPGDLEEILSAYPRVHMARVSRGREAYDPSWRLHYMYPAARISSKYYGEEVPDKLGAYSVRSQLFYEGHEQRILFRCPELPEPDYSCCAAHRHISAVAHSITTATRVDSFRAANEAYMSVSRTYCSPYVGASSRSIRNRIRAASRYGKAVGDVVDHIARQLRVPETTVQRNILQLVRTGEVRLSHVKTELCVLDFKSLALHQGRLIYQSANRKIFYDVCSGTMSDAEGNPILTTAYSRVHLVRSDTRSGADTFGVEKVRKLLSKLGISYEFVCGLGLKGDGRNVVDLEEFRARYTVTHLKTRAPSAYRRIGKTRHLILYERKKGKKIKR